MNRHELEIKANELASKIKSSNGDLSDAYKQFEVEIKEIEKSMPIESVIPSDAPHGLGMALKTVEDGESLWNVYSDSIKAKLCDPNGKLHNLVDIGLASSTGAVVTAILETLVFPPAAIGMVVPIAAILVTTGLEAYCEWTEEIK
ncbi:MAG: hypothetical protein AAFR18_12030 [Cyanobacteria bacterium J06627_32]